MLKTIKKSIFHDYKHMTENIWKVLKLRENTFESRSRVCLINYPGNFKNFAKIKTNKKPE